jgi:lactoylglutathione lyase
MPATEIMHTCIRVLDEDRSLGFYRALGFEERDRKRVGGDTATIIFMGLPGDGNRLELTLNDGRRDPYDIGTGYGHIALAIADLTSELERLAALGITPERAPYVSGPGGSLICFVRDPDGYRIELIQTGAR